MHASPMSMARESALASELERLDALGRLLQSELPAVRSAADLLKQYADVSEHLEPVVPWEGLAGGNAAPLLQWARETIDFLEGIASVAVASSFPIDGSLALAALAGTRRWPIRPK